MPEFDSVESDTVWQRTPLRTNSARGICRVALESAHEDRRFAVSWNASRPTLSLRPFEFGGYSGGSAGLDPVPWPRLRLCGSRRAEAPCNALPEVLDPLGQCLRTPAERRVHRRFVSAHCLLAGYDAVGQGVLGKVYAQARHSVGEPAHVDAG